MWLKGNTKAFLESSCGYRMEVSARYCTYLSPFILRCVLPTKDPAGIRAYIFLVAFFRSIIFFLFIFIIYRILIDHDRRGVLLSVVSCFSTELKYVEEGREENGVQQ